MADCAKETEMKAIKTLVETALLASYPEKYVITRNASRDAKNFGNRTVGVYVLSGGSQPIFAGDTNCIAAVEVPFAIQMRLGVATEETDDLEGLMNNAESVILNALKTTKYEFKSNERETGLNEIWQTMEFSFQCAP